MGARGRKGKGAIEGVLVKTVKGRGVETRHCQFVTKRSSAMLSALDG